MALIVSSPPHQRTLTYHRTRRLKKLLRQPRANLQDGSNLAVDSGRSEPTFPQ